jgi:hypothetical protein
MKLFKCRPTKCFSATICFSAILFCGCGNRAGKQAGTNAAAGSSGAAATVAPGSASSSGMEQLIDTNKMKADVNEIQNALATGKLPDTTQLKLAAGDVLSTTAKVLSDSGISKMGNSSDPSQKSAQDEMIKLRNASGLTPAALDSLKKAAALLNSN